jgi:hypothetical protein
MLPLHYKWEISLCCGKEDGNNPKSPAALFVFAFYTESSLAASLNI